MNTPRDRDLLPRKHARSVPALYGLISLLLVIGAVALALSTPPPSTPPLAAVAPAPQEQVEIERVEQNSRFGDGTGGNGDCTPGAPGCAGGGVSERAGQDDGRQPSQPPSEIIETQAPADLRRCVHGPGGPRQTEDPQSPPCKREIFTGDNGGATWTGVTPTDIRIAWPTGLDENGNPAAHDRALEDAIVAHVNQRYELYGRKFVLVPVDSASLDGDAASSRALAREVAALDAFASLGVGPAAPTFHTALAGHEVVSVMLPGQASVPSTFLDDLHPHVWSTSPSLEEALGATAALICDELVERPARHAGPDIASTTRGFGIVVETRDGYRVDPARLLNGLAACGAAFQVAELDRDAAESSSARDTAVRRFASDGVTTVICVCHSGGLLRVSDSAEAAGYQPEWLLTGHVSDEDVQKMVRGQRGHAFGLTADFRALSSPVGTSSGGRRFEEQYWYHAMKEGNPQAETTSNLQPFYQQLLVLAAGVQWAGPELTPTAFGDALAAMEFANPDVGAPRWFQPSVNLGPGDHGWNSDFALTWWELSAEEEERISPAIRGRACYVAVGIRVTAATIPAGVDAAFFDPEEGCR